jgi:plastocyanin
MIKTFRALSAILALLPLSAQAFGVQVIIDGQTVTFADVPQSAWFATYVRESAQLGIVTGYRDDKGKLTGRFGPSNNITIAEALKIAVEGAGYDEEAYSSTVSSGVDHWSSAYVSVAKSDGFEVIDERTHLDRPATRAQVAALFTSAFDVDTETPIGNNYDDVSANTEFGYSIEALTRDEVVSGDTDIEGQATGTYRPNEYINRAEVAKMVITARDAYGTPGEDKEPSEEDGSTQTEANVVTYMNGGFTPSVLRIQKGESVTFKNQTSGDMWVASDTHPTHTELPGFDAGKGMDQGDSYIYTFTKIGSWGYHNHANASHRGTIIVE